MKKLFYFLSLACVMMFASCSSDDEENVSGEMMTVGVGLPGADATRVDFENNEITKMVWSSKDQLKAVGYWYGWAKQPENLKMVSGAGTPSATFTGNKVIGNNINGQIKYCTDYRFVYTGKKVTYSISSVKNGPGTADCKYLEQVQNQNDVTGFEHIKDHLFMVSDMLYATGTGFPGGILKLQNSILRIDTKNLPAGFDVNGEYTVKFFVNYENGVDPVSQLTYNGVMSSGKYLYMAFDPVNDLAAGKNIAFEISSNGKTYYTSQVSGNGKDYQPGKIYTVAIDNKWTWNEKVESGSQAGYSIVFNTADKVKEWAPLTSQPWDFLLYESDGMRMNKYYGSSEIIYVKSPVITLGSSNTVSFNHKGWYFANMRNDAKLVVREENGSSWTTIENVQYPKKYEVVSNKDLQIPAEFNGKNVEFAFEYDWDGTNSGYWVILDFSVKCN